MNTTKTSSSNIDQQLQRLSWLSRLLDTAFSIPGTRFRIGLDGLLGLIPGIGDSLGAVLSSYIIFEAARIGAPKWTLLRMVGNVAIESVVGVVPILGDIFDIAWKANVKNVALLRAHLAEAPEGERSHRQIMRLIVILLLLAIAGITTISFLALRFLYQLLTSS